jgi:hypothetical protein
VTLLPPLDYLPLVHLQKRARIILTDSGGIQEEAPAFGVPVLVLREVTERPEGVAAGTLKLVGMETERSFTKQPACWTIRQRTRQWQKRPTPLGMVTLQNGSLLHCRHTNSVNPLVANCNVLPYEFVYNEDMKKSRWLAIIAAFCLLAASWGAVGAQARMPSISPRPDIL